MEKIEILSVHATEYGLDVKLHSSAQGNLALIGLLEKIKLTLLEQLGDSVETHEEVSSTEKKDKPAKSNKQTFKYDA